MNTANSFQKEGAGALFLSIYIQRMGHMSLHGMAVLIRTKPAGTLILNFMASRTQKLMSALSHPVNVILLQQLKLMKTAGKAQTAVFVGLAL